MICTWRWPLVDHHVGVSDLIMPHRQDKNRPSAPMEPRQCSDAKRKRYTYRIAYKYLFFKMLILCIPK